MIVGNYATIEPGRTTSSAIRVPPVERFVIADEPTVVTPLFALGMPPDIQARGLHHNAHHFTARYKGILDAGFSAAHASQCVPKDERWYLIGGHPNFYHFIVNYAARIYYYKEIATGDGRKERYVVADDLPAHYLEYLQMLGVVSEDLIKVSRRRFTRFSALTVSNIPLYMDLSGLRADASAFDWIRRRINSPLKAGNRTKIFLSRAHTVHRRIANEAALVDIAGGFGYRCIRPEDYNPPELLAILNQAQVLVSALGAGMTNSLFCPDGSVIIEIAGPGGMRKLNSVLGHMLARQHSIRVLSQELNQEKGWQYRDLHVEPDLFMQALRMAEDLA